MSMNGMVSLIRKYRPLLKSMAFKYSIIGYEDCYQEAVLGLIIAYVNFDDSKGEFGAFAKTVIRNRLNRLYHIETRQPIPVDFAAIEFGSDEEKQLQTDVIAIDDNNYTLAELVASLEKVAESLSEMEQKVLKMKMDNVGITQTQIARELGVSQSTILRVIKRIGRMLQNETKTNLMG